MFLPEQTRSSTAVPLAFLAGAPGYQSGWATGGKSPENLVEAKG